MAAIILAAVAALENGEWVRKAKASMIDDSPLRTQGPAPISRLELGLLAAVLLVGAVLRLIALVNSGVEHFDEGVYASNLYCSDLGRTYPDRRFYAPPLLPALIEIGGLWGLPPNLAALLPGFVFGCGTIAALWWLGRSWFAPSVGLFAGTIAATSDFHILYSTAALTDVLLGLWCLMALDALGRSWRQGSLAWAAAAGAFSGLAWWTKYNGWLPLAIGAAALPLLCWIVRPPPARWLVWLGCVAFSAAAAVVVWSPYYISLRSHGGYAPIAANHARYVVGPAGWADSSLRQVASQFVIEKEGSCFGVLFALIVAALLMCSAANRTGGHRARAGAVANLVFWGATTFILVRIGTSFLVLAVAALVGLAAKWWWAFQKVNRLADLRLSIGLSLLSAWWLGLLAATGCYQPYPRLVLPWLLATWLAAGLCLHETLHCAWGNAREGHSTKRSHLSWGLPAAFGILATAAVSTFLWTQSPQRSPGFLGTSRQRLVEIAGQVHTELEKPTVIGPEGTPAKRAVYVHGEPAMFFQLCAAGETLVVPANEIPPSATYFGEPIPTYLVIGPHAQRDRRFQDRWVAARENWQFVAGYDYQPSPLVWLDLNDPRKGGGPGTAAQERIEVYRLK